MSTWGIIPAAGVGSRIQPLAFSKELLPVGARLDGQTERPRAICEYLIDRMLLAGATKMCFVISPEKADILTYFGNSVTAHGKHAQFVYVVQPSAGGLCDALFRAQPLIAPEDHVLIGLPDTIWYPEDGLARLPDGLLSFLLFPVDKPELFDAVVIEDGAVREIQVKRPDAASHWIWGAFKMPGTIFHDLFQLWSIPERGDEYIGTLVNAYLARGGYARGIPAGEAYVDVGTLHGYRNAIQLLAQRPVADAMELTLPRRRGIDGSALDGWRNPSPHQPPSFHDPVLQPDKGALYDDHA